MSSEAPKNPSRRELVKAAALAAAAPVLAPLAAHAETVPTQEAAVPVTRLPADDPQERDPVAAELTEALKVKYRDRLTAEQWEEVRRGIEGNLRAAKQLRDFALPIDAEPAFAFRAYRGGER